MNEKQNNWYYKHKSSKQWPTGKMSVIEIKYQNLVT